MADFFLELFFSVLGRGIYPREESVLASFLASFALALDRMSAVPGKDFLSPASLFFVSRIECPFTEGRECRIYIDGISSVG